MPRSNRSKRAKPQVHEEIEFTSSRLGIRNTEIKRGVEYTTQTSVGANAEADKSWTCPNCNLQISRGLSHVVAWDSVRGVETRRHFHNACWKQFQGPLL